MRGRDRDAVELRAVAPLVASGSAPGLVGPITLVAHGERTVGVTSAELVRPHAGESPFGGALGELAVVVALDGSAAVPVERWTIGRYSGLALLSLAAPLPTDREVVPLQIAAVCASLETRGAPAGLIALAADGVGYRRALIPVHIEADDDGGMRDEPRHLVRPLDAADAKMVVDGAPVFAWFPPDPVLGRPSEVVLVALAAPCRMQPARPREIAAIAELIGLEDLGRALLTSAEPDPRPELVQVAGEISDER
ncbi:MAG: hypothetical protein ACTHU0_04175 [Kofleriaceae bacterium]